MSNEKINPPAKRREVESFLARVKSTPPARMTGQGRLLFGLDATMSRQPLWDHASHLHAEMFLESARTSELQVQLAYYQGLLDFRHSAWVRDPETLLDVMTGIRCQAGHTQIARLLKHILAESRHQKVNAAIFVGDAMEENEETLYKISGQLGLLGTPLFVFQEGYDPEVELVFKKLANLSGGACCHFDAGSVAQLKVLLGAVANFAKGGYQALQHYAEKHSDSKSGTKALEIIRQLPGPKSRS